jgi:hypothetical protein
MMSLFRDFYFHVNDEPTSLQAAWKEQDPRVESVHEKTSDFGCALGHSKGVDIDI